MSTQREARTESWRTLSWYLGDSSASAVSGWAAARGDGQAQLAGVVSALLLLGETGWTARELAADVVWAAGAAHPGPCDCAGLALPDALAYQSTLSEAVGHNAAEDLRAWARARVAGAADLCAVMQYVAVVGYAGMGLDHVVCAALRGVLRLDPDYPHLTLLRHTSPISPHPAARQNSWR